MNKRPYLYLIIGIAFLVIPTTIYLIVLVPQLKEEYAVLMSSGGVIAGAGVSGSNLIPEELKFSKLLKLASTSFTLLTVILLVEKFIVQLVGLVAVFILSYIIFIILKECYKNARRRNENRELANEIARTVDKNIK